MVETASRAGFHTQHLRHGDPQAGKPASANTRGDRARLLKEAMRALEESDAARQAARNPSIVAADTHLNTAYANDGNGGLRELTKADGIEPVLEYGDARIDAVKRKWHPQAFETTTIVSWVPKSLLEEVPDYYPVYDAKTKVEVGRRSRWVMPEDPARRAEVDRWFRTTHEYLTGEVLTGGPDAVHGVVWNFDESAVHVHWMCDTMAPLQKDLEVRAGPERVMIADGAPVIKYKKPVTLDKVVPLSDDDAVAHAPEIRAEQIAAIDHHGYLVGADGERLRRTTGEPVRASDDLRVEAQQMWGQSSDVTEARVIDGVEKQVKITGATKMSRYQEAYREHLIERGFDVELAVNPEGTSLDKAAFGASEADRLAVANQAAELTERERALLERRADLARREAHVAEEMERLDQREASIDQRAADVAATTRQQVLNAMEAEARKAKASADRIRADAETQAEAIVGAAQTEAEQIESQARTEGLEQGRAEVADALTAAGADREAAREKLREVSGLTPEEATQRVIDEYTVKSRAALARYPVRKVDYDEAGNPRPVTGADGKPVVTNAWEQMKTDVAHAPGAGADITVGQARRSGQKTRRDLDARAGQTRSRDKAQDKDRGFGQ